MRTALCIGLILLTATSAAAQPNAKRRPAAAKAAPAAPATAPAPAPIVIPPLPANTAACGALSRTVELNLKTLSQDYANADLTKNAGQAAQVAIETGNHLAVLKMNLDLLSANRCTPWNRPVGLMNYGGAAMACAKAGPADKAAKCDQDSWEASF